MLCCSHNLVVVGNIILDVNKHTEIFAISLEQIVLSDIKNKKKERK